MKSFSEAHPDFGVASEPVDVHLYVDGSVQVPLEAELLGLLEAGVLGDVDDDGVAEDGPVDDGTPVQAMPLRVKLVGTGLVPVQAPLNPKAVVAPVAMDPL